MCTQPTRPVVVIVCDDAKTAVAYFTELKRQVKTRVTLFVKRSPCDWAGPKDVLEAAAAELHSLKKSEEDRHSVWVLIDMEEEHAKRVAAKKAKEEAEKLEIRVALSNPCFEIWTLLHLVDTGSAFQDCRTVLRRVEQEWKRAFDQPFGPKAQADYKKIVTDRDEAAQRARAHHLAGDPSWTEIYLLIEEISSLSS